MMATMGVVLEALALMLVRAVCRKLFLLCGDTVDPIAGPTFDTR